MQSLCFALLATAAALQAPMTRTQQRRVVAQRVPMDVLAPTSTALCAGADDDYEAPKIEFDPDADGARAASDIALPFGHGEPTQGCESAPSFGRSPRRRRALNPIFFFFPTQSAAATCGVTVWNSTSQVILSISAVAALHAIEQRRSRGRRRVERGGDE